MNIWVPEHSVLAEIRVNQVNMWKDVLHHFADFLKSFLVIEPFSNCWGKHNDSLIPFGVSEG